jgi:hypothetical protein
MVAAVVGAGAVDHLVLATEAPCGRRPGARGEGPARGRTPCAADGADEATQLDPAVAAEMPVLAWALLSEGPPLLGGPPVPQGIRGVSPTPADGYLHSESDIVMRSPDGRIVPLPLPALTLLLDPPDVPPADAETPLDLP